MKSRIVILALSTRLTSFIPFDAASKEVAVLTSAFFTVQEYEAALDALCRDKSIATALVTQRISLADLHSTFEALKATASRGKILVQP